MVLLLESVKSAQCLLDGGVTTWTGEVAESVANPSGFPGAGEPTCAGAGELFHRISGKECFTFQLEAG